MNISCCPLNLINTSYSKLSQAALSCNNSQTNFTIMVSQFILCINSTPITNRSLWGQFIWFSIQQPPKDVTPQIIRIPRTCTNVSIAAPRRLIHFNISFPILPECNRRRRAWYNTLLGGLGTEVGITNSIDLEALLIA